MVKHGSKLVLGLAIILGVITVARPRKKGTAMIPDEKRRDIVNTALAELGSRDAAKYGAAPGVDWCGIFVLWVYHQNDVLPHVRWAYAEDINRDGRTDYGFLMVPPYALPQTRRPEPGDVAYFNRNQHHALVEAVRDNVVDLINGNGEGGKVTRSTVPISSVTAFFSIAPYLTAPPGGIA